jgi:hypothetical protein
MTEQHQDGTQVGGGSAPGDETFANLLGDGWQTAGDGIYHRVPDRSDPADDDIDALEASRTEKSSLNEVAQPKQSGRRWLRRGSSAEA